MNTYHPHALPLSAITLKRCPRSREIGVRDGVKCAVKSIEQQSLLCVHRLREGINAERTACINRIRGLLLEFGVAVPTGSRALRMVLDEILEDGANEMNGLARMTIGRAQVQWRELDEHLAWCDERLAAHEHDNADVRRAAQLMGIGPVGASAAIATVGDFKQFKSGAQLGAWLGLTPGS